MRLCQPRSFVFLLLRFYASLSHEIMMAAAEIQKKLSSFPPDLKIVELQIRLRLAQLLSKLVPASSAMNFSTDD